jgi:hypothetical protein
VQESLWVAKLLISGATAKKMDVRHHVTHGQVRDAIVCVEGLSYAWDDDPMTPEEAANFYEADEDPEVLCAKHDAALKGITVHPAKLVPATQAQPSNSILITASRNGAGQR